jgi:hypothetical protein
MTDVGDLVTANLLVQPFDDSTIATLEVVSPDGVSETPVAFSEDGGNTWNAPVEYTLPGIWVFKWTVMGTGASVEFEKISVAPSPDYVDPTPRRVYANTVELANYLQAAPPLDSEHLLREASRVLDDALMTAVYYTDDDGYPAAPKQREALRQACCMVVEWWGETGDPIGADGDWLTASAGDVLVTRGVGPGGVVQSTQVRANQLPPRAWGELTRARILPGVIYQR